ncbi:MAG: C40 family peptidase [Ornithinimicrobium sp.]|uniref:C40 family peptidase n=1 Tax=Ornithinimicrobium sp. TaxID=1977084 RepID=UPI003D9B3CE3
MSHRTIGRHRAPSRVSSTSTALTRTAKATAVAATSGGLLAASIVPATADPRGVVDDVAAVQADRQAGTESAVDLLAVELPTVLAPKDRPAVAAPAPKSTSKAAEGLSFGTDGFEGFTPEPAPAVEPEPVVEPEPEPVVEPEPVAPAEPIEQTESASSESMSSSESASSSESSSSSSDYSSSSSDSSSDSTSGESSSSERESSSASRSQERAEAPAPSTPAPTGGVLSVAAQYTGIMYQWAGSSPSTGFDCSGYTSYVFAQVGINLPRTASAQQQMATPVSTPQPGDLVFYGYPAYHIGIYAGNGMMYDSGKPGIPSQLRPVFSGVSGYGRVG